MLSPNRNRISDSLSLSEKVRSNCTELESLTKVINQIKYSSFKASMHANQKSENDFRLDNIRRKLEADFSNVNNCQSYLNSLKKSPKRFGNNQYQTSSEEKTVLKTALKSNFKRQMATTPKQGISRTSSFMLSPVSQSTRDEIDYLIPKPRKQSTDALENTEAKLRKLELDMHQFGESLHIKINTTLRNNETRLRESNFQLGTNKDLGFRKFEKNLRQKIEIEELAARKAETYKKIFNDIKNNINKDWCQTAEPSIECRYIRRSIDEVADQGIRSSNQQRRSVEAGFFVR